jgi:hypothetical protein
MPSLVDFLAGGAPTAADETTGAIAGSLASDPSRLAYSSGPVGQALGQISGGFYQAQARDAAQRIADAHAAAMPSLLNAYQSDNPWQAITNDPNAPPYAKWMIGQQTPQQVAQTKEGLAGAALKRAELPQVTAKSSIWQQEAGAAGAPTPAGGPGGGAPGTSAGPAPVAGPQPLSAAAQAALAMPPGPAKLAALQALPPAEQAIIRGRARRPAGVASPGGGPAPSSGPAPIAAPPVAAPTPAMPAAPFGGTSI